MSAPAALVDLLATLATDRPAGPLAPRRHPCSRCSTLVEEYRKHDASWMPPESISWVSQGRVYFGALCAPCTGIEYRETFARRTAEIGPIDDVTATPREKERRAVLHARLAKESERFKLASLRWSSGGSIAAPREPRDESFGDWLDRQGIEAPALSDAELAARRQEQLRLLETLDLEAKAGGI